MGREIIVENVIKIRVLDEENNIVELELDDNKELLYKVNSIDSTIEAARPILEKKSTVEFDVWLATEDEGVFEKAVIQIKNRTVIEALDILLYYTK